MNIIDWIISGILLAAVIVFFLIVRKKIKKLKLLDLEAMPKAKLQSKKYELIADRLGRKTQAASAVLKKICSPAGSAISNYFQKLHVKLTELEHKYKQPRQATPQTKEEKEKRRQKIAGLIATGEQKLREEAYVDAENIFLEIIRLNSKEVEAYKYLGELYFAKKDYDHAIETLQFAKKLDPENDRIYCDLGLIFQAKSDMKQALEQFQSCVRLVPNNPRNLSNLLELAIVMKKKALSAKTLEQLKKANPENQKIAELENKIKEL